MRIGPRGPGRSVDRGEHGPAIEATSRPVGLGARRGRAEESGGCTRRPRDLAPGQGLAVWHGWSEPLLVSLGLVGAVAVVTISALVAKSDLFKPLRNCGRNSIAIYLALLAADGTVAHLAAQGLLLKACCSRPAAQGLLLKACCSRPAAQGLLLKASWIADIGTISLLVTASGGGAHALLGNAARDPALPVRTASAAVDRTPAPAEDRHALQPAE